MPADDQTIFWPLLALTGLLVSNCRKKTWKNQSNPPDIILKKISIKLSDNYANLMQKNKYCQLLGAPLTMNSYWSMKIHNPILVRKIWRRCIQEQNRSADILISVYSLCIKKSPGCSRIQKNRRCQSLDPIGKIEVLQS